MEIALIVSLIALAVALPGCIADSLTVIGKIRARRAKRGLLKKAIAAHVQDEMTLLSRGRMPQ